MNQTKNFLSIIVPCYNEQKYISHLIDSILDQDYPQDRLEVLIIDGMSADKTREIIKGYCTRYSFIRLIDNHHRFVPHALNAGIEDSIGEIIIRMDVHCVYPRNYLSVLVDNLLNQNAENVGCAIKMLPANNSIKCRSILIGMSHPFGTGNVRYKAIIKYITEVETVPFGCFKRDIFTKIGLFDTDLIRNQDDEFNARIKKYNGKVLLIPGIVVNYYARETITKMFRTYYQYGIFKPLVNKKIGFPTTLRQFIPPFFILWLILGSGLTFANNLFLIAYIMVLSIYLLISLVISSIQAVRNRNLLFLFTLPFIFSLIHLGYGWGYIIGMVKFNILCKKSIEVESTR